MDLVQFGMGPLQGMAGIGLGIAGLEEAKRRYTDIGKLLDKPPLAMEAGAGREALLSPQVQQMLGYLTPEMAETLTGGAGGAGIALGLNEAARVQGIRDQMFGKAEQQLLDMPTDPWSDQVHATMANRAVERVNQAERGAEEALLSDAGGRGAGGGRWLTGQRFAGRRAAGAQRGRVGADLSMNRELARNQNLIDQSKNLSGLYAGRQVPAIDWSSYLAPQMNWPITKASVQSGLQAFPLQMQQGLAQGMVGGAAPVTAAMFTPQPKQPSPWGAIGSAGIGAGAALGSAAILAPALMSDRNLKHDFKAVQPEGVLDVVVDRLPVERWKYRDDPHAVEHIGPMAQDFRQAFGVGDGRTIDVISAFGVAIAAVQGLTAQVRRLASRIEELEKQLPASSE